MDVEAFWNLIDESREVTGCEAKTTDLRHHLETLSADEVISFDRLYHDLYHELYSWDLWGLIYLVAGGCSDDGFDYFRSWIMSQGREAWALAVSDPEGFGLRYLVDGADPDDYWCEIFTYAAYDAYEAITGEQMPLGEPVARGGPTGDTWEDDDLPRQFPRLASQLAARSPESTWWITDS
jgi:hypothetical protein